MIAKRIQRKTVDNFSRLGNYIAAAREEGEKLDQFWMSNFNAGDSLEDLDIALIEAETVQALNLQALKDKTYHLVVSFRDEEPSAEALKDIEKSFADALGFGEHQRIAATHRNTDNYHMHVAINRIHPKTFKPHMPFRDFKTLERISREMEQKWNLKVDLGMTDKKGKAGPSPKARDFEAITWEQSFDSYVRERKDQLLQAKDKAGQWQDLHAALREHHLMIKPRGSGFVIASADGLHGMKASALDWSFSKPALEKQFGKFRYPGKGVFQSRSTNQGYVQKPVTKHPGQVPLWKKFVEKPKRKEHVALIAFRNWRDMLAYEALSDPLALAVINAHRKTIKGVGRLLKPAAKKHEQQYKGDKLQR